MIKAYTKYWLGYANWEDRITRSEWWWVMLWNFLISVIFSLLISPFVESNLETSSSDFSLVWNIPSPIGGTIAIIAVLYSLAALVPSISFNVRRLRDAGFHWALIFLGFIPIFGGLVVFILLQFPTKNKDSQNINMSY